MNLPPWYFCLLCLWCATGCRTTATRQVSDPGPAVARLRAGGSIHAEADNLVNPLVASGEVYGMVVGVVTPDGTTRCFGYGRTGRPEDASPPDGDTLFQIGSLTKLFTETLLVQLVNSGQLRYDDTVRSLLPTTVPVSAAAGGLTLYQLATHTAGLPREPFTPSQLESLFQYFTLGSNLYAHLTVPYCLDYLQGCHPRLRTPPEYVYSNFGAGLFAYLIREKMGRRAEDLIVEKVCRPLALTNTVFVLNEEQQPRLAVGHVGNQACWKVADAPLPPWDMGDFLRPISGLYSSVNDLLLFAKANLGMTSSPLAPALAATHETQIKTQRGGEALGWIVATYDEGRRTLTFKDGFMSGYCGFIGLDLEARVGVVVLANKYNWDEKVGMNLLLRVAESCAETRSNARPKASVHDAP